MSTLEKIYYGVIASALIGVTAAIIYGEGKLNEQRHAYYVVCTAKGGTTIEASNGFFHCVSDKAIIRIGEVK